jgi:uncharacterized protein (TIGR03067 family)
MKRTLLVLFAAMLLAAEDDASKRDREKMQGDWAAVSLVADGAKSADDEAQSLFRTVKGNGYTMFLFNKPLARYTFTLDATKEPKTIDVTPAGTAGGKTILGIYKLDGERWTICFAAPGKVRPKDFTSTEGSGQVLTVWEREKKP